MDYELLRWLIANPTMLEEEAVRMCQRLEADDQSQLPTIPPSGRPE